MPIDYGRLVDELGIAAVPQASGAELTAVQAVMTTLRECSHAAGATFTEYGPTGGRVVVAQGGMSWALGQPVAPELVAPEVIAGPYSGRVETMPAEAAQQLRARGMVAVVGHPVRSQDRVVGALHLYFDDSYYMDLDAAAGMLRLAAACTAGVYTGRDATPVRSPGEEDDRSLFLTVAGHELRTPVTVIKGYASLLADRWEELDDDQRRSATKVLTQRADELAQLVDRLLATAGEASVVRMVPFDLVEALSRAAGAMPRELRGTLRAELPTWLPPAAGDPDVIGTVLTELVTNAVRAATDDPRSSTVDLAAGSDQETVYFQVRDRGIGIDPAQAEVAFERFWRAPRPAGDRDPEARSGVGLGLYLVRRLVERQNGWVSLRPRDGGGTVAEVRLHRADSSARRPDPGEV